MIALFILSILGILISIVSTQEFENTIIFTICKIITLLLFISILFIIINIIRNKPPQAIDVYRNKTELMYNFHNNGTYDSVIVWKVDKK